MNKIKEFAELLLGVTLEQEFETIDCPFKFKITNEGLMQKMGDTFEWHECNYYLIDFITGKKVIKILTDEEMEYLSAIIKPFKDTIQSIRKEQVRGVVGSYCCLVFETLDCKFALPCFESNEHYVGMELEKKYSLEELGL